MPGMNLINVRALPLLLAGLIQCLVMGSVFAQSDEELAKKLSNPVAAMISVPLQANYDERIGPEGKGSKLVVNIQPVIPFQLSPEWNLISRTVLPVVNQHDVGGPGSGHQAGLGDITQSFFFSPVKAEGGLIWGVGPVFTIPTGTENQLSARQWGGGPTGLALVQNGPWTYGMLANHVWSFTSNSNRNDVSATFLQPFVAHTTKEAWTFGANLESTYDWEARQWSVPINLTATKLLRFGNQPLQIGGGVRYWLDHPDNGPKGWGFRFVVTFLFPK